MFTKNHIVAEIQRTAKLNGGRPLGFARFETETGVKRTDWQGKFWARWGDALREAGLEPNSLQGRLDDDELLESIAALARELGHFPVANEVKLKARTVKGFPWPTTFERFGRKAELSVRLRDFCTGRGYEDVAVFCDAVIEQSPSSESHKDPEADVEGESEQDFGYVYLLKSGRFYKIGRSNAAGRRERELAIQLPDRAQIVHSLKTDDPVGIEAYWHGRFADRRKNGEWFELTARDVGAFKRRKFM